MSEKELLSDSAEEAEDRLSHADTEQEKEEYEDVC